MLTHSSSLYNMSTDMSEVNNATPCDTRTLKRDACDKHSKAIMISTSDSVPIHMCRSADRGKTYKNSLNTSQPSSAKVLCSSVRSNQQPCFNQSATAVVMSRLLMSRLEGGYGVRCSQGEIKFQPQLSRQQIDSVLGVNVHRSRCGSNCAHYHRGIALEDGFPWPPACGALDLQ